METNSSANVSRISVDDTDTPKWAEIFVIVLMSIVTLIGVPGNGIILIVQWKNHEKSSTDILVATMAAFELICAGFNSVLVILKMVPAIWTVLASSEVCNIHDYTVYVTSISSTLLLTVIALDRYVQTYKPLNTFYSKKKAVWICACIIAVSPVVSLPGLFKDSLDKTRLTCQTKGKFPVLLYVLNICLALAFCVMFVVVVFCYTKVALLIRRRHQQKASLREQLIQQAGTSKSPKVSAKPSVFYMRRMKIYPQNNDESLKVAPVSGTSSSQLKDKNHSVEKVKNNIFLQTGSAEKVKNNIFLQTGSADQASANLHRQARLVHRTTLIMFLITSIYIASWTLHWVTHAFVSHATSEGRAAVFLGKSLYMINCITNPIFFILLSTKFRKRARIFLSRCKV